MSRIVTKYWRRREFGELEVCNGKKERNEPVGRKNVKLNHRVKQYRQVIEGLLIMTAWPSQIPSFPGLTGESRKKLDARLRPAGMTFKQEWNFKIFQFNYQNLDSYILPPGFKLLKMASVLAQGSTPKILERVFRHRSYMDIASARRPSS